MSPEQLKKLKEDAICVSSSYAMAASRTATARRAAEDALYEENRLGERLRDLIAQLAKAAESEGEERP